MSSLVPIAARIRLEGQKKVPTPNKNEILSLEEQIEALEKQIKDSDSGTSSSSGDSDDDEENDGSDNEFQNNITQYKELKPIEGTPNVLIEKDGTGKVVKFVSSLASERIEPLSKKYLPSADCGSSKSKKKNFVTASDDRKRTIRFEDDGGSITSGKGNNKFQRRKEPEGDSAAPPNNHVLKKEGGMEKTIREMLRDYTPTSVDRKPFWCRICRFQGKDENDLFEHRKSEFHATAARMEMKMSYCQLCRKQFTSPHQLKEHLGAKAHKERLHRAKEGNARREKFK